MTEQEKQEIISAVLSSLRTNSKAIEQLTSVTEMLDDDQIELNGGRKVSYAVLMSAFNNLVSRDDLNALVITVNALRTTVDTKADTVAVGGVRWLDLAQWPFAALFSVEQVADSSVSNNKMYWGTNGHLKYKDNTGVVTDLSYGPRYGVLYYVGNDIYRWNGTGFTKMGGAGISAEDIIDSLTSGETGKALSANMGRELKAQLDELSESTDDAIVALQQAYNSLSEDFANGVTDGFENSASIALSARQGLLLKNAFLALIDALRPTAFWNSAPPAFDWMGSISTFSVEYTLTKCTTSGKRSVSDGEPLSVTISPNSNYSISSITWTMLGVSHTVPSDGTATTFSIPSVRGNVAIVAVAEMITATPTLSVIPASLNFSANVGSTATKTLSIGGTNTKGPIYLSTQAPFSVSPAQLPANGGQVTVSYSPTASGSHSGSVSVTSQGAATKTVSLSGSASAVATPVINVNPSSLSFSTVVGNAVTKSFVITGENLTGGLTLATTSPFSLDKTSITKAQAQSGVTVTVTYNPNAAGTHNAIVGISGGGAESQTVTLGGTATNSENTHNVSIVGNTTRQGFTLQNASTSQEVAHGAPFTCVILPDTSIHADMYIQDVTAKKGNMSVGSWDGATNTFTIPSVTGDVVISVVAYIAGVKLHRGSGMGRFGAETSLNAADMCFTDFIELDDVAAGDVLHWVHNLVQTSGENYYNSGDIVMFTNDGKYIYFDWGDNGFAPWFLGGTNTDNVTNGRTIATTHTSTLINELAVGKTPLRCRLVFRMVDGQMAPGSKLFNTKSGGKTYIDSELSEFYEEFDETSYSMSLLLSNCQVGSTGLEASNADVHVLPGQRVVVTLTPKTGREIGSVTATMGGVAQSVTTSGNNRIIDIANVTGDIVITES